MQPGPAPPASFPDGRALSGPRLSAYPSTQRVQLEIAKQVGMDSNGPACPLRQKRMRILQEYMGRHDSLRTLAGNVPRRGSLYRNESMVRTWPEPFRHFALRPKEVEREISPDSLAMAERRRCTSMKP